MQVENIECQLFQAQINLYAAGQPIAPEAIGELEAHLEKCPDCKKVLDKKRKELEEIAEAEKPVADSESSVPSAFAPVAEVAKPESLSEPAAEAPKEPVVAATSGPEKSKKFKLAIPALGGVKNWKPIAYSGGLAIVLVAMSFFARDPSKLLGEKAMKPEAGKEATTKTEETKATDTKAEKAKTEAKKTDEATPPVAEPKATPTMASVETHIKDPELQPKKPEVKKDPFDKKPNLTPQTKLVANRTTPAQRKPKAFVRKPNKAHNRVAIVSGIRVYDSNGKPLPARP